MFIAFFECRFRILQPLELNLHFNLFRVRASSIKIRLNLKPYRTRYDDNSISVGTNV